MNSPILTTLAAWRSFKSISSLSRRRFFKITLPEASLISKVLGSTDWPLDSIFWLSSRNLLANSSLASFAFFIASSRSIFSKPKAAISLAEYMEIDSSSIKQIKNFFSSLFPLLSVAFSSAFLILSYSRTSFESFERRSASLAWRGMTCLTFWSPKRMFL